MHLCQQFLTRQCQGSCHVVVPDFLKVGPHRGDLLLEWNLDRSGKGRGQPELSQRLFPSQLMCLHRRRRAVLGIWSNICEFFTCWDVEETVVGRPCVYALLLTHSASLGGQAGRSPKVKNTGVKQFTLQ